MKYLLVLLAALTAIPVAAQEPPRVPEITPPQIILIPPLPNLAKPDPSPTPEDYEQYLKRYEEDIFSLEFWKEKKITHRITGEDKKLSEFTVMEQSGFILMFSDRRAQEMGFLAEAWDGELAKFDAKDYKAVPREKIENPKQNPATKAEVEKYSKQLLETRKKFAVSQEAFAEKFVKDNTMLGEKEGEFLLKHIRDFNDEHKLVERKK